MNRKPSLVLCGLVFVLEMLQNYLSYGTPTDIYCLKTIQKSFKGLGGYWDFSNTTEGSICRFVGIECWHPDESRVLNINLQDMGLTGQFPLGVYNCTTLTGLYLSGNQLNGSLPSNINTLLPYVTALDLSSNNFSGEIPTSLSKCQYLNVLQLDHNKLSGKIPLELGGLDRLKQFSVASNNLRGQVPRFRTNFSVDSYAHNPGLCGGPLPPCPAVWRRSNN